MIGAAEIGEMVRELSLVNKYNSAVLPPNSPFSEEVDQLGCCSILLKRNSVIKSSGKQVEDSFFSMV